MARIRLPGPLTAGLAVGIPSATSGILRVLEMQRRSEEAAADRALRERTLGMAEQEFGQRQQALREAPTALAGLMGALRGTPPVYSEPVEGEPGPEGEPEPTTGALLSPGQPPATLPQILTQPDLTANYMTLVRAGMHPDQLVTNFEEQAAKRKQREEKDRGREQASAAVQELADLVRAGDFDRGKVASALAKVFAGQELAGQQASPADVLKALSTEEEERGLRDALQKVGPDLLEKLAKGYMTPGEKMQMITEFASAKNAMLRKFANEGFLSLLKGMQGTPYGAIYKLYQERVAALPEATDAEKAQIWQTLQAEHPEANLMDPKFMPMEVHAERTRREAEASGALDLRKAQTAAARALADFRATGAETRDEAQLTAQLNSINRALQKYEGIAGQAMYEMADEATKAQIDDLRSGREDILRRLETARKSGPERAPKAAPAKKPAPAAPDARRRAAQEAMTALFPGRDFGSLSAAEKQRVADEANKRLGIR